MAAPNVIDVFAGVGGLSLGTARAGFNIALAVDKEPIFLETHKKNFPGLNHLLADIAELSGHDLLIHAGIQKDELAGLVGGPPCQGFSVMGRRNQTDERNGLFGHFFRLVKELDPKFFVAENVLGLEDKIYDEIRDSAFEQVRGRYTLIEPLRINASAYGAPTSRTRVFYIGYKPEFIAPMDRVSFSPPDDTELIYVEDALKGLPMEISPAWEDQGFGWLAVGDPTEKAAFAERLHGFVPEGIGDPDSLERLKIKKEVANCLGTRHSPEIIQRYTEIGPGGIDRKLRAPRLKKDGFCPTIRAGTGSDKGSYQAIRPIHYLENRVITPREAARLQGFPDWFVFHETKWHSFRQIGNSVSPLVAEKLLKVIFDRFSTL